MDWAALMRLGIGGCGLRPAEFWALTPAEFWLICGGGPGGAAPMNRARLDALLERFPDRESPHG